MQLGGHKISVPGGLPRGLAAEARRDGDFMDVSADVVNWSMCLPFQDYHSLIVPFTRADEFESIPMVYAGPNAIGGLGLRRG